MQLVDLSNNNPDPLDFHAIRRSGFAGVWLKVAEGLSFTDPTFERRAREARAAGLRAGGYYFARPVVGSAHAAAAYFVERLGKIERRDLRPFLDLEKNDEHMTPHELYSWARSFLRYVHVLTGVRAATYSGAWFLEPLHWTENLGTGAGLLVADYGPNDGRDHGTKAPAPWRRYLAHQYTSRGHVPGVPGDVDLWRVRSRRGVLAHPIRGAL